MEKKADVVFEASWEVCNKVGGIYTVVKSKAAKMTEVYAQDYFMIGPYFPSASAPPDFYEELPNDFCKAAFEELKNNGIMCHFGKWLIEGSPSVILVDFANYKHKINDIKRELWDWYKIDSLRAPYDYDEPVAWAYCVGMLVKILADHNKGKKIAAHFHEWLSGAGLLYLKKKAKIATIFTTHATILGRTLASSNADLYNVWNKLNPLQEAYKYGIEAKYLVEKSSALNADVFTTVSEITGMESSYLLAKKPDVLLPNGLDISKFPGFEEIMLKHRLQRNRIREFILHYFFPYYKFDIKDTFIYFLAGRYEFHDKGIDIYIKALGRLNEKLKEAKNKKTIVAFIWVPTNLRGIKTDVLENKTLFRDIKDNIEEDMGEIENNILYALVSGEKIEKDTIFNKEFLNEIKIKISRFSKSGNPPLSTHDLYDQNDQIFRSILAANITNSEKDRVKVVYYPTYLSGADGLLDLNYYEAMQGSHLGIFPSYYEPWGYTPLEAGALGVSSVTTDLAGFGRYFCAECTQNDTPGIFVLKRLNKSDEDVTNQLVDVMFKFANFSKEERAANKLQARKVASMADWKSFVKNYIAAHDLAVEKAYK